jgi:hypothetical protein
MIPRHFFPRGITFIDSIAGRAAASRQGGRRETPGISPACQQKGLEGQSPLPQFVFHFSKIARKIAPSHRPFPSIVEEGKGGRLDQFSWFEGIVRVMKICKKWFKNPNGVTLGFIMDGDILKL